MPNQPRRFVDLHTHSTASDGTLPPAELIRLADGNKLAAIALTDHDTTAGLHAAQEAAKNFPKLRLIPGIEISARSTTGTLHILGLGIDPASTELQALTEQLRQARSQRNPFMVEKLRQLGLDITMQDVLDTAQHMRSAGGEGEIIGRLHMAETLRRKGHVKTIVEAFDRYLGNDAPAYVDKERLEPRQAIAAITAAGGTAVLAHPVELKYNNSLHFETILRDLMHAGLTGIEVYHSSHSPEQTRLYLDLARRYGLTITGGSDFHGAAKPEAHLGNPKVPLSVVGGQLAEKWLKDMQ